MNQQKLAKALHALTPDADFVIKDGEIIWNSTDIIQPSANDIELEITRQETLAHRFNEYPSITDQLDMLYWDKVNGTNNWQTTIQAVKDKYPKE